MKRVQLHNRSKGFTIVELMVATSVFSIVLLVVAAGVISFTRQYYKGITSNATQNVTRSAMSEISQAVQFTASSVTVINTADGTGANSSGTRGYCIDEKPYYYVLGKKLDSVSTGDSALHVLITGEDGSSCPGEVPTTLNLATLNFATLTTGNAFNIVQPRELMAKNMRLAQFSITTVNDLQKISLKVANGDSDLLCNSNHTGTCTGAANMVPDDFKNSGLQCRGGAGNQYCAVSQLSISVQKRL